MNTSTQPDGRTSAHVAHTLSTKPTPEQLIRWAKNWAVELWLCNYIPHTELAWYDHQPPFGIRLADPITASFNTDPNTSSNQGSSGSGSHLLIPSAVSSSSFPSFFEEDPDNDPSLLARALSDWDAHQRIDMARVKAAQQHADVRREANHRADWMLRNAAVSEAVIKQFKQVLPYKMAHLHKIKHPRRRDQVVGLWVLEGEVKGRGDSNDDEEEEEKEEEKEGEEEGGEKEGGGETEGESRTRSRAESEDERAESAKSRRRMEKAVKKSWERKRLVWAEINVLLSWSEVKKRLLLMAEPVKKSQRERWWREARGREWKYALVADGRTARASGSDAAIRHQADWEALVDVVKDKRLPYSAAIVFQVSRTSLIGQMSLASRHTRFQLCL